MKPADLGFSPDRFPDFRRYPGFDQLATAQELAYATERFQIYNGPTGSGKSLTYAAAAKLRDARWLVLTGTKGLQSQLLNDGLVERLVYGHRNYPCAARVGFGIEDADTDDLEFQCSVPRKDCEYLRDVEEAVACRSVVSNYAFWLSIAKYSDPNLLGDFDLLVLDEAHTAANWLTNAVAVTISRYRLRRVLGLHSMPTIPRHEKLTEYVNWLADWHEKATGRLRYIGRDEKAERRRVERLISDLEMAFKACDPDVYAETGWQEPWVVSPSADGNSVTFSPRWGSDFAERYLFRGIPNVLLTSATVTPQHATYLGIQKSEMRYREIPSPFDPRRRPVIWIPTVRVDFRMTDGAKWQLSRRVDELIEAAIDQRAGNGVIHTGSYERTRDLLGGGALGLRYAPAVISHQQNSRDFAQALERFKAAGRAGQFAVFASPRLQEGVDLPDELCRWAIILKSPVPDTREPLAKLRNRDDLYRLLVIGETAQQMVGRGMRGAEDFVTTWILDDHWGQHYVWQCPLPASFKVACRAQERGDAQYRFLTQAVVDSLPPIQQFALIGA